MFKIKSLAVLLCCALLSTNLLAQASATDADRAAVLSAVDAFFAALARGDRAGLENTTFPGSVFVASTIDSAGQITNSTRSRRDFVTALSDRRASRLERYWDPSVQIRDGIAHFWAPYDFHVDGEFTHCGIDSFQLIRSEGRWKIGSSAYTVRRQNCEPSPLGPVN